MSSSNVFTVGKGHEASQTDSSPKMPRPKVLSAGKGHVATQNESGPPTMMKIFKTLNQKLEEKDRLLDRRGNKIENIIK